MGRIRIAFMLLLALWPALNLRSDDLSGEDLDVRLFVIGQGDPVYSYWGHTGLAIRNSSNGRDVFFDFGNFYFEDEDFFKNFAVGRNLYMAYAAYTEPYIRTVEADDRELREYVLNLSPRAKLEMYQALVEKSRPENRTYLYHHYYDNCSTRIRDYIDAATDGQLKARAESVRRTTFRESFLRFTSHNKLTGFALSLLQGPPIDGEITLWQEMYLPEVMGEVVAGFSYRNEEGETVPLVSRVNVLNEAPDRESVPPGFEHPYGAAVLIGVLTGAAAILIRFGRKDGRRGLFAFINILTGAVTGLLGSVLFFLAVFTDHSYSYNNLNLFMLNPLALILIPMGIAYWRKGESRRKGMESIWLIINISTLIMILLKALTPLHQDNLTELLVFVPLITALGPLPALALRKRVFTEAAP